MKLNLGCGNKKKDGFLGVDRYPCDAVDMVVDINGALPFKSDTVHEIWMDNVIEHVADISYLMQEIHRVSENNAVISIITPHYSSAASWRDPTHLHHLSFFSMDHFEKNDVAHYTGGGFKVMARSLSFVGGIMGLFGHIIFKLSPAKYESKWCFIFRASTLRFTLRVVKPNDNDH